MSAVVQVVVTADEGDLGEAIGELMICLNARYWDDGNGTCEGVLEWLQASRPRAGEAPGLAALE